MTDYIRQNMVLLIEDLASIKVYRVETPYLAVSIADKYLVNCAIFNKPAPCLITLAVVCTLMAAKLNESLVPSFNRMINLLRDKHSTKLKRQDLIDLEESVLRQLEFSV